MVVIALTFGAMNYYVIMNKGGDLFDDVLEIPLIGERKITSGLENCSIWWGQLD